MSKLIPAAIILGTALWCSCNENEIRADQYARDSSEINTLLQIKTKQVQGLIDTSGKKVVSRFVVPKGFRRVVVIEHSFADYLRNLSLKKNGEEVRYYDGSTKANDNIYVAVVDMKIGDRDLQQCADAVMRLRAEYLFKEKQYDKIHFNFTNGFRVDYSEWRKGKRIVVKGNKVYWSQSSASSTSYASFLKYMDIIFSYAGTLSLSRELQPVEIQDIEIGDIFIQGGSPGHAVIVVDMAIHSKTQEKIFLLAQSYMPAQETQILVNPNSATLNPWYSANVSSSFELPEWTFRDTDLKRFPEE